MIGFKKMKYFKKIVRGIEGVENVK